MPSRLMFFGTHMNHHVGNMISREILILFVSLKPSKARVSTLFFALDLMFARNGTMEASRCGCTICLTWNSEQLTQVSWYNQASSILQIFLYSYFFWIYSNVFFFKSLYTEWNAKFYYKNSKYDEGREPLCFTRWSNHPISGTSLQMF